MSEKTVTLDLTPEEMVKRLFPGREVVVSDISKRISDRVVLGWRVEFTEKE